tara:strand:- start:3033 stop:5348 length:2316 start_codon:yes stop_codon:yes gene_type:complete
MSYYVTNENSFLDIKNAHLRVTGNVHTDVLKVGSIGFQPAGSNISGTVNFTNVTTGVTTTSNLDVGGTLNLGTIELSASTHTLDHITARGNVTSTTVQFDNAHTSLVTSGNVEVGGELTVSGNANLLSVSNVASIKKDSNVVTEFPRSKKLIKYPRVALTANSSGGYVAGRSTVYINSAGLEAWKMFDGDSSTHWHSENGTGYWNSDGTYDGTSELVTGHLGEYVTLQLPTNEKVQLHSIRVFPRGLRGQNYSAGAAPKDVVVIGSNGGSSWDVIATTTLTNYSFGTNPSTSTPVGEEYVPATFDFEATEYYQYVGLIIKSLYSGGHVHASISALEFFGVPEYDPDAAGVDVKMTSYPNVPNTDWLEVYYDAKDLGNGIITTVDDLTPGGTKDGTAIGDLTVSGGVFTFDGTNDLITSTTLSSHFTGDPTVTYACWVKFSAMTTNQMFFTVNAPGVYQTGAIGGLFLLTDGTLYNTVGARGIKTLEKLVTGRWYHLVGTKTPGDTGLDTQKLYINGIQAVAVPWNASGNQVIGTNPVMRIGGAGDGTSDILNGSMANARLFNRALTSDEVWQLYAYQKEDFGHGDLSMTHKAGRLGIGTSEPRAALDVQGSVRIYDTELTNPVYAEFSSNYATTGVDGEQIAGWRDPSNNILDFNVVTRQSSHNAFDADSALGVRGSFTVPHDGVYVVYYAALMNRVSTSSHIYVHVNGSNANGTGINSHQNRDTVGSMWTTITIQRVMRLKRGDKVQCSITGGFYTLGNYSFGSIYQIGA